MNRNSTFFNKLLLSVLLLQAGTAEVTATVRRVTPSGIGSTGITWANADAYGNLQTAINASANGDTVWVKAGTYQPGTAGVSFKMKDSVVLLGGFNGTETADNARNWTANRTVLKGNGNSVIQNNFTAANPMTSLARLDGFTVTGGRYQLGDGGISSYNGGGIGNEYASPTIINCRFYLDTSYYSGAIGNYYSMPLIENVIIDSNYCDNYGGGMTNWNESPATVKNVIIADNYAVSGGGGVLNAYDANAVFTNVVFRNNRTSNSVGWGGGAIFNYSSAVQFTNVTVSSNFCPVGGSIYNTSGATTTLLNCVFWGNTSSSGSDINISSGTVTATYCFTQASTSGTGNILGAASPFVDASAPKGADGLWMTEDDGLKPAMMSPVRDAGTATGAPATDILGRPRPGGAGFDMGAYESSLRLYVKHDATGANNGSNWANAFVSLEEAIDSAKASGEIWVAAGTYTPSVAGAAFRMKDSVVLLGGFNGTETTATARNWTLYPTILKGNGNAVILNTFTSAVPLSRLSVLDGFTITGGSSLDHSGGIHNTYASPTISHCQFLADSSFLSGSLGCGGGIGNNYSAPLISDCLFKHCWAGTSGGGIFNLESSPVCTNIVLDSNGAGYYGGAIGNWANTVATPVYKNIIVSNNYAVNGGGGEISAYGGIHTVVTDAVFLNNRTSGVTGTDYGSGGAWTFQGVSDFTNVTFISNSSNTGGAVSSNGSGTFNGKNCIFWNNTASVSNPDVTTSSAFLGGGTANITYSLTQTAIAGTGNMLDTTNPFLNSAAPEGADGVWLTADDGLQLPFCSNLVNVGNNTGVTATDILGRPRIVSTTVDLGAYEKQSDVVDYENNARLSGSTANALPFIPVCDDGEWTFYADPTMPDSLSFGIAWGAANASAKATAQMQLTVDAANTAATTATDGIWAMKRYWNVALATALSAPVKVRFYYNPADTVALHTQADAWNTSGLDTVGNIKWFKTTSGPYTPSLVTSTDINGGNKLVLTPVYGSDHGVAYVQFNSVSSFSGGTAALGAQAGAAALPVTLIRYAAQYADNGAAVLNSWEVGLEQCRSYGVQRSTDGVHFETVGNVSATQAHSYSFKDVLPAAVLAKTLYYRLSLIEVNDNRSYSQVVRLAAGNNAVIPDLAIQPNPVSTSFTISGTGEEYNGHEAVITDLFGKVVATFIVADGVSVDTRNWIPGVYMLRLSGGVVYRVVKK